MDSTHSITETEGAFAGAGETLFRRSVQPPTPWATLCVIHGYGDHSGRYLEFMRWMAARGIACHATDLRGQGRATGRRGFVRKWDEYLGDVDALLALPEVRGDGPMFLLGHSHGGLVVAAWAERPVSPLPHPVGCILVAPYFAPKLKVPVYKKLIAYVMNPLIPWLRVGSGISDQMLSSDTAMLAESREDPLLARTATPRWYVGSLAAQAKVIREASDFKRPLLVVAGDADPIADVAVSKLFFDRAGSVEKMMALFPGMLHEILRETAREEVFQSILSWMRKRCAI